MMRMDSAKMPTDPRFNNLAGHEYGRLTVDSYAGKRGDEHYWLCKCSCGNEPIIHRASLRNGSTKSCGCLRLLNNKRIVE